MKQFLLNLKIRAKLLSAFGSILLLSVILIVIIILYFNKILSYKELNKQADELKINLKSQELSVKEFIYEGYKAKDFQESERSSFADTFRLSNRRSLEILENIIRNKQMPDNTLTTPLSETLKKLSHEFDSLKILLKERGFKDYGLEGTLRKAIHSVENMDYNYDKAQMLTLRRNEKDFFLRRDLKYKEDFNKNIVKFIDLISQNAKDKKGADEILNLLYNYQNEFNAIVKIETAIGLTENDGIRGNLKTHFSTTKPLLAQFTALIDKKSEEETKKGKTILAIILICQMAVGAWLAIVYSGLLTTTIKEIRNAMQKLSSGTFSDYLVVRSHEELGQTKEAFNQFVERLHSASDFATSIGEGNLTAEYDVRFSNDVLAQALIALQKRLKEAEEHQVRMNWTNKGAVLFNEILKNDTADITSLSDEILKFLIQYLNVNQGAVYLLKKENNESYLDRIATFAYGKKKYAEQRISAEAGLLGQCILEKGTIVLKEVPRNYVMITSGLGEATPRFILIVPIKQRDTVIGVIELASFNVLQPFQIEFAEKMTESIAVLLVGKLQTDQTKRLLSETQEKAQIVLSQEEEMKQTHEELMAVQEEMTRQRKHMELEIRLLREELASYEGKEKLEALHGIS